LGYCSLNHVGPRQLRVLPTDYNRLVIFSAGAESFLFLVIKREWGPGGEAHQLPKATTNCRRQGGL